MITDLELEDFLSHHGVKGQKWGVRNAGKTGKPTKDRKETQTQRKLRNVKRVCNGVLITVGAAYVAAFLASEHLNSGIKKQSRNMQNDRARYDQMLNDMLKPKDLGPKVNLNFKSQSLNRGPFYNYKPPKNARQILMDQERQRNSAYQVKQMLKKMGGTTL